MKSLGEMINEKYSFNHLASSIVRAPKTLDDDAVVEVTLTYYSEGYGRGRFTIKLPIILEDKDGQTD